MRFFCVHIRKTTRSFEFLGIVQMTIFFWRNCRRDEGGGDSLSNPYRTPLVFIERKGKLIFCVISAFYSHTTYTQLCSMQGIKHNTILPQSSKSFHFSGASLLISRRSLLFFHHLLFYLFTSPLLFPLSAGQGADPLVLLTGGATISVDGPYLSSTESLPPGGCHGLPALPDTRC